MPVPHVLIWFHEICVEKVVDIDLKNLRFPGVSLLSHRSEKDQAVTADDLYLEPIGDVPSGADGALPGRVTFEVSHDAHDLLPTITDHAEITPFVKELLEDGQEILVESAGGNKLQVTFANSLDYVEHHKKGLLAVGVALTTGVVGMVYYRQRKRGKR